MWAYFLIIIATDKVINFKTTLFFFSGPNGTILKLKVSTEGPQTWHSGDCLGR
jgi:hypothetical protein